jgi:GxxExxY protein
MISYVGGSAIGAFGVEVAKNAKEARRTRRKYNQINMHEEAIIKAVLDEAFYVHKSIGPGMLENVYQTCLAYRLRERGFYVETEKAIPVVFESVRMDCGYRADIVVEHSVVVDTKVIEAIGPLQIAQLLTYLRFLNLHLGLILNFNTVYLKDGIRRVINSNQKVL